jgi:sugar/nucleoside kinase (ribokinase family)
MPDEKLDCLCAGIIVADTVCRPIDRFPSPGGLGLTEQIDLTVGGCAANVATDLAKLGRRVAITGVIGDDVFGRAVCDMMTSDGVNCEGLNLSSVRQTAATMIVNIQNEDRRFIHVLGANNEFTGLEVTADQLARTKILSIGGYGLVDSFTVENALQLLQAAKSAGVTTVLDVVLAKPLDFEKQLAPLLPLADYFLPNEDEAKMLTGLEDPVQQAQRFREAGANTVIVTCGENGAVLHSDNVHCRSEVYTVDVVDTTGSGDAFVAGFIHGLLLDSDLETCLKFGSALGAICVQSPGATTGIPLASELEKFAKANDLTVTAF